MKYAYLVSLFWALFSCKSENKNWQIHLPDVTSSSSPKACDLNGDGILDIVMGAGGDEWKETERGIIAIDGGSGELLWAAPARNQIVGSAIFLDINLDGTKDVIIGGRTAELRALDGKSGELIWEFYHKKGSMNARDDGWYNFYNAQLIKDQDNDELHDILICNGGDAVIPSGMKYRPAGKLMIISSQNGKILAEDLMPDGQETYFSPLIIDENTENPQLIFGTGGETRPGHLYLCNLKDLLEKNLKNAKILDSTLAKGYEAPPVLAHFNDDKFMDLVVNTAEGSTKLIDGKTHEILWMVKEDSSEVFSQPAVGLFTGNDKTPDVFVQYAKGKYPDYKSTSQLLIDGKTGKIVNRYLGKRFTFSSPVVADIDQDKIDEVILNTVEDSLIGSKTKPFFELRVFNFKTNEISFLGDRKSGACFASTPWLGDLDNDGLLDIVYSGSPATRSEFPGLSVFEKPPVYLSIFRIENPEIPSKVVKWGSYMNHNSRSILE